MTGSAQEVAKVLDVPATSPSDFLVLAAAEAIVNGAAILGVLVITVFEGAVVLKGFGATALARAELLRTLADKIEADGAPEQQTARSLN